jgi:hypothetical protein
VRCYNSSEEGNQVDTTSTICQSNGLPKQAPPPEHKKHVTGSGVEVAQRKTSLGGDVAKDRVDGGTADTHHPHIPHGTEEGKILPRAGPIEWIIRVGSRTRNKDNILVAFAQMSNVHGSLQIDQMDGPWIVSGCKNEKVPGIIVSSITCAIAP